MPSSRPSPEVAQLERIIDSKERLLAYLRSGPKRLSMESFICLTKILGAAGWTREDERWCKEDNRLGLIEAAIVEVTIQIGADKQRVLRQTVTNLSGLSGQNPKIRLLR